MHKKENHYPPRWICITHISSPTLFPREISIFQGVLAKSNFLTKFPHLEKIINLMKNLKYEHQSIFPLWGGSNFILGTGRNNQAIIFNTCIIFEKKIRMEKFLLEKKNCQKKLVGKSIFVRKNFVRKNFFGKKFCWKIICQKKKTYWENNSCKGINLLETNFIGKKIIRKFFIRKWWV